MIAGTLYQVRIKEMYLWKDHQFYDSFLCKEDLIIQIPQDDYLFCLEHYKDHKLYETYGLTYKIYKILYKDKLGIVFISDRNDVSKA